MRGYFKASRIYVRKIKDGKPGFAVFAPFITSVIDNRPEERRNDLQGVEESGIMVNLGWVPSESKKEVSGTDEPLPVVEFDETNLLGKYTDPFTGFIYKSKYDEDAGEIKPKYTDLTAIVRGGESQNYLLGNVNFPKEGYFQYADLDLFSRYFLFRNIQSSRVAYLERVVPTLAEGKPVHLTV